MTDKMTDPIVRIPESQRNKYSDWLSTVTTPHGEETVIAWQLAKRLGLPPLRLIRAMRGQKGQEDIQARVDAEVDGDPSIEYMRDAKGIRRTRFISPTLRSQVVPPSVAAADVALERGLSELEVGQVHTFREWPVDTFPKGPPGVYTVWHGDDFLYVGIAYRDPKDTNNPQARGVWGRLSTHASGRRSGDQFNIYVCDRFIVPELSDDDRDALRAGSRLLDTRTRDYIRDNLCFRVYITDDGTTARKIEHHIRTHGLQRSGRPWLNPSTSG